jgi:hypothetical protein
MIVHGVSVGVAASRADALFVLVSLAVDCTGCRRNDESKIRPRLGTREIARDAGRGSVAPSK